MRTFFILFFIFLSLEARENPFFPTSDGKDIAISTNKNQDIEKLTKESITLESNARVLQKVTLEYKNLDGSVETKSLNINKAIDWHKPISITQNQTQQEPPKQVETPSKDIKNSTAIKTIEKNEQKQNAEFITPPIKFIVFHKKIELIGSDLIIRNFMMTQPCRIVLDFSSTKELKNQNLKIENSIFKIVKIGVHDGYYRVVIELDGKYKYKLNKLQNGYEIEFF